MRSLLSPTIGRAPPFTFGRSGSPSLAAVWRSWHIHVVFAGDANEAERISPIRTRVHSPDTCAVASTRPSGVIPSVPGRVADVSLDIHHLMTAVGLKPAPVNSLGHLSQLNDEIRGQIFCLNFPTLFPRPDRKRRAALRSSPMIRTSGAADKVSAMASLAVALGADSPIAGRLILSRCQRSIRGWLATCCVSPLPSGKRGADGS